MPLFWFLAGALSTLAALVLLLPWLRATPKVGALPALPWQAGAGAVLVLAAAFGLYRGLGHPELAGRPPSPPPSSDGAASPTDAARASSMNSAIAGLEARLAKGNGTPDDWELLAKSYDFLEKPAEAKLARAHRLPAAGPTAPAAASGASVSGEISLVDSLRAKIAPGAALFVVAKSVGTPGAPVAVFRAGISGWPAKFTLDDSQAMLAGRNLTNAGRVTILARISQNGQAMPATGDLMGSTGPIDPAERRPVNITIDRVVP